MFPIDLPAYRGEILHDLPDPDLPQSQPVTLRNDPLRDSRDSWTARPKHLRPDEETPPGPVPPHSPEQQPGTPQPPPTEDDRPAPPPVQLPGQPHAPERVAARRRLTRV